MPIVILDAINWSIHAEQADHDSKWPLVRGKLVGFLVAEDDEKIVLAQQWFIDGTVRNALVIPKVCILYRLDTSSVRGDDLP